MLKKMMIIGAFLSLHSCGWVNDRLGLKPDNVLEESIEFMIEKEVGLDIDLTPGSPE